MKTICIFGHGGFAREVACLARQLERPVAHFIEKGQEHLFDPEQHTAVVAVGSPSLRFKIVDEIMTRFHNVEFETLVSPTAKFLDNQIVVGQGSVICANCVLTCDIELGDFAQLNVATTIGHDVRVGDFFTTAPGVHINGANHIGDQTYFGSNSCTIENLSICGHCTFGAGAVVVNNLFEAGTYVGVPAKRLGKPLLTEDEQVYLSRE